MKTIVHVLAIALIASGCVCAAEMPDETFRQIMTNIAAINYWSKGPESYLAKCEAAYPETTASAQSAYLKWKSDNVDFDRSVDGAIAKFVPALSIKMNKSASELQLMLTKFADKAAGQGWGLWMNKSSNRYVRTFRRCSLPSLRMMPRVHA